jgi:hypothetical protein
MGSVFGKQTVAEAAFEIILNRRHHANAAYEIRRYGERFAAKVSYSDSGDMGSPFGALAKYIGSFGTPQNDGGEAISMTAPVVIQDSGTQISMTAPVVTENTGNGEKVMKFVLPAKYDDMSKIPKPTNPMVHIEEIPPQVGAVHRFSGSMSEATNREMAAKLAQQLMADGVDGISEDYVLDHFQYWGYNPPFTIPMFRRNEVWVELTGNQVDHLLNKFNPAASN